MVKQFVDHFRMKEYGFNFFPALGWVFGAMAGQAFSLLVFAALNLLRENRTIHLNAAPSVFYSVLAAGLFVLVCHVVKDDTFFPVVFSLAYVPAAAVARLISYVTASLGVHFFAYVPLGKYLFNPVTLAGSFVWALSLSLLIVILRQTFKRLDYALLLGFPAAELLSYLFYPVVSLVKGEKPRLSPEFLFVNLAEAVITGFFVTLSYALYLRARGLRISGGAVESTGEETAPRTRLMPRSLYLGAMAAVFFLNLVLFGFVIRYWNWTHAKGYEFERFTGRLPNLETGAAVIIVLSVAVMVISLAVSILYVYKMWTAVQDRQSSMLPGLAAGLLFVPVFNLYWGFRVIYGFARDYNALVKRRQLNVPPLPAWLYLAQVILALAAGASWALASAVFSIPVIAAFALMAVGLAAVHLTCQAVNRIPPEVYRRS
jgi:hypothetical protein